MPQTGHLADSAIDDATKHDHVAGLLDILQFQTAIIGQHGGQGRGGGDHLPVQNKPFL
jgi:hypothetical protein